MHPSGAGQGPGREEQFVGTLRSFFPSHDEEELAYLKSQWGNFGMLLQRQIVAYAEDGTKPWALGHPDNQVLRPGAGLAFGQKHDS